MKLTISFFLLALLISGCAHHPINAPLASRGRQAGYRFENAAPKTNSDDLLLMLAFSGGGTRAAALSYSVLKELRNTEVGVSPGQHPLLNDVDLISSVSGGSFTAAYYALWGEPKLNRCHVSTMNGFIQTKATTPSTRKAEGSFIELASSLESITVKQKFPILRTPRTSNEPT